MTPEQRHELATRPFASVSYYPSKSWGGVNMGEILRDPEDYLQAGPVAKAAQRLALTEDMEWMAEHKEEE